MNRRCRRCPPIASITALLPAIGWLLIGEWTRDGSAERQGSDGAGVVLVTRVDDAITSVIADHLSGVVDQAEEGGYEALVVELDTPGGVDTAMRDIVQEFLAAEVPVVVHVSPPGARAASAGALIAWSAHVVAMAPGTTIGAATPVDIEGGEVGDKVVNDAAAYARAIADERGRDADVAGEAVTEGRALSAPEALDAGVADLMVDGRAALLEALDGTRVVLPDGVTVTLRTVGAAVEESDLSLLRSLLQWLADPNLAFLFLSLGTLAIVYELVTPGVGVGGGLGVVLLVLALFSLAVLPVEMVGFLFLGVAVALFAVELFAPGVGAAAVLGSVALALGGVFLFGDDPGLSLSLATVVPTVTLVGVGVLVAGRLAVRVRSAPPTTGSDTLIGRQLTVASADGGAGQALVEGAWWTLRSRRPLEPGDRVRVREIDGLDLVVDLAEPDEKETRS